MIELQYIYFLENSMRLFIGIVIGYFLGTLAPIQTRHYASLALQKLVHAMSALSKSLSDSSTSSPNTTTYQSNQPSRGYEIYIPKTSQQRTYQSPRYQTTTSTSPDGSSF